jgi:hypothetical protein
MACCIVGENLQTMEYIESQIRARRKLRDLAAEIGIGKSSLSRHMRDCVRRREAVKHSRERKINLVNCRVITAWPEEGGFKFTLQAEFDSHGGPVENNSTNEVVEIPATELRESDVIVNVSYQQAREPRKPQALAPDEPDAEEVSELSVAADDKLTDAPCEEIKVAADDLETVKATPTPCEHVMVPISSGIERCQLCGFQKNEFQTVGQSRKAYEERNRDVFSRRPRFGRF